MKILDNGWVYEVVQVSDTLEQRLLIGGIEKSVVEGDNLVHYVFDEALGDYVEVSREPYKPPEPEIDELTQLKLAMAEMAEAHETDKTDLQLAIAELAELITQGVMSSGKDIL